MQDTVPLSAWARGSLAASVYSSRRDTTTVNCQFSTVNGTRLHLFLLRRIDYGTARKGVIILPATGYIQVRAYASKAQFPLKDVAITVTASDGTAIAMRVTDRNGRISPIAMPVPDKSESQAPDPGERPFAVVNLFARLDGYEQIESENLQVFADTTTIQNLEMIPLAELPGAWNKTEIFDTPPQNL